MIELLYFRNEILADFRQGSLPWVSQDFAFRRREKCLFVAALGMIKRAILARLRGKTAMQRT